MKSPGFMANSPAISEKLVYMDHDGGVDDLLSLLLLLTMPHVTLLGVSVTPADCYLDYAVEASRKILDLLGNSEVEVAGGDLHGVNAFPAEWRAQPHIVNALPILLAQPCIRAPLVDEPAHQFLARKLSKADEAVTIVMTGPGSNLAAALQAEPDLKEKIAEVVWMAGAIDVVGNVRTFAHDGSAEWNVFWDPPAAHQIFSAGLNLTLFPLDVTNLVPVGWSFLQRLATQRQWPLSDLAGQCWATTVNAIPHYDYMYYMWDILATSYIGRPDLITFRDVEAVVIERGRSAGKTLHAPGSGQWL
jgi:purine nucleosidase